MVDFDFLDALRNIFFGDLKHAFLEHDRDSLHLFEGIFELLEHCNDSVEVLLFFQRLELAKIFGSDSSPKFVNGVLGSVIENAGHKA